MKELKYSIRCYLTLLYIIHIIAGLNILEHISPKGKFVTLREAKKCEDLKSGQSLPTYVNVGGKLLTLIVISDHAEVFLDSISLYNTNSVIQFTEYITSNVISNVTNGQCNVRIKVSKPEIIKMRPSSIVIFKVQNYDIGMTGFSRLSLDFNGDSNICNIYADIKKKSNYMSGTTKGHKINKVISHMEDKFKQPKSLRICHMSLSDMFLMTSKGTTISGIQLDLSYTLKKLEVHVAFKSIIRVISLYTQVIDNINLDVNLGTGDDLLECKLVQISNKTLNSFKYTRFDYKCESSSYHEQINIEQISQNVKDQQIQIMEIALFESDEFTGFDMPHNSEGIVRNGFEMTFSIIYIAIILLCIVGAIASVGFMFIMGIIPPFWKKTKATNSVGSIRIMETFAADTVQYK